MMQAVTTPRWLLGCGGAPAEARLVVGGGVVVLCAAPRPAFRRLFVVGGNKQGLELRPRRVCDSVAVGAVCFALEASLWLSTSLDNA